jgi:hypothetical protein
MMRAFIALLFAPRPPSVRHVATLHSLSEIEDVRVIGAPPDDYTYCWYVIVEYEDGRKTILTKTLAFNAALADARRIRKLVAESREVAQTQTYRAQ